MKIIISDIKYKVTVIFIHGYTKTGEDWNITAHNKEIGIESHIRKTRNTVLITLDEEDYRCPISDISSTIYEETKHLLKSKVIIVTHSYGSMFGMSLAILYPKFVTTLIMLDPSVKTNDFLIYLKSLPVTETKQYKIDNFESLPNPRDIPKHIIVRVHWNFEPDNKIDNNLLELDHLVKKNTKSRLMIHISVSHMIHYKIPHVIIDSIKEC